MKYKEFKNGVIKLYKERYIGSIHLVDLDQPGAYILSIYVNQQNKGYGQALLECAISKAVSSGCAAISLYVDTKNEGAIRFYKRNRFFISLTTSKKNKVKSHYLMVKMI